LVLLAAAEILRFHEDIPHLATAQTYAELLDQAFPHHAAERRRLAAAAAPPLRSLSIDADVVALLALLEDVPDPEPDSSERIPLQAVGDAKFEQAALEDDLFGDYPESIHDSGSDVESSAGSQDPHGNVKQEPEDEPVSDPPPVPPPPHDLPSVALPGTHSLAVGHPVPCTIANKFEPECEIKSGMQGKGVVNTSSPRCSDISGALVVSLEKTCTECHPWALGCTCSFSETLKSVVA
jgi:hypothetical protein